MSSGKQVCVNCKYEDATKTTHSYETGVSIWCKLKNRFISEDDRQGVRKKTDGTYKENIWCSSFVHY